MIIISQVLMKLKRVIIQLRHLPKGQVGGDGDSNPRERLKTADATPGVL